MGTQWETVWTFNTAKFTVSLAVAEEEESPADNLTDDADIAFASEGGWHWFTARVQVVFRDDANPKNWAVARQDVLGEDYLGCCSYRNLEDFRTSGYFRDMVHEAIREARGHIARIKDALT